MEPNIELAKPRDFGEIIGDTFTFIKQNIKGLLKSFFIFCGFFMVAGTVIISVVQYKNITIARSFSSPAVNGPVSFDNISSIWMNMIWMILFGVFGYCANLLSIMCYVAVYKQKGNIAPTTEEVWGYFKYYFFRVLVALIVVWVLWAVGFMLCLVPGIWLFPILGLIFPIMIVENASFGYAFSRAFKLISNNWWTTAGAVFVVWLIAYIMVIAISIPSSIINVSTILLHPNKMPVLSMWQILFSTIMQQLLQVVLLIPTIGICLCYFNLSESKDGTSLLTRIDKFGEQNIQPDLPTEEY